MKWNETSGGVERGRGSRCCQGITPLSVTCGGKRFTATPACALKPPSVIKAERLTERKGKAKVITFIKAVRLEAWIEENLPVARWPGAGLP